jgi:radical SAM superfamily enzyme YgiQ (UPF0313 family)
MKEDLIDLLKPSTEVVGIGGGYNWELPLNTHSKASSDIKRIWYLALPISSAHRGGHSGGGALIEGAGDQQRYQNEGTVYPHCALVEMITYHQVCFPEIEWRYLDLSHETWQEVRQEIRDSPPDIAAFSVYTATAIWAYIVAAEIKASNPKAVIIFGNDHASLLHREILLGAVGSRVVDFIGLGNNGPFTLMNLIHYLQGQIAIERVPSVAYRKQNRVVVQNSPTYPLDQRLLADYRHIETYLEKHYDHAFRNWYSQHYDMKRMVTLAIDGGCNWGSDPRRRCKHCSIQGLTPKWANMTSIISSFEMLVGGLNSNIYAAGDSTLGFSSGQWKDDSDFLDRIAEACSHSRILSGKRFLLAYGLVSEFLKAADLCKGFVRTWNVGIESFDPILLANDSKSINREKDHIFRALDLARNLKYRVYASGILGLPGTTLTSLKKEVSNWVKLTEDFQDILTTVSVALPAVIPGSRMYWDLLQSDAQMKRLHGELIPCNSLTESFITRNTEVSPADVRAALQDLGRCVILTSSVKFGGYMMGGIDEEEELEWAYLRETISKL